MTTVLATVHNVLAQQRHSRVAGRGIETAKDSIRVRNPKARPSVASGTPTTQDVPPVTSYTTPTKRHSSRAQTGVSFAPPVATAQQVRCKGSILGPLFP